MIMSDLTSEAVNQLVQDQLRQITDHTVRDAIAALLVAPSYQTRLWFDGSPEESCWSVAEHQESNTLYIYSEVGFAPASPWGIVSISDRWMGMDSNWFGSLERAFYDSFAAMLLPIWRVIKRDTTDEHKIIASDLSDDDARNLIARLNAEQGLQPNTGTIYAIEPRSKKWW
jgi:hypothetical protein